MSKEQPRVPGMRDTRPNREQRRHPEGLEGTRASGRRAHENPNQSPETEPAARDRQPDDLSARAKSSGHGKKTADKWNQ